MNRVPNMSLLQRESNVETSLYFPQEPATSTSIQLEEETVHKWSLNKLSKSIMKCLIYVFVRFLRASRAMEMERSGTISRSGKYKLRFVFDLTSEYEISVLSPPSDRTKCGDGDGERQRRWSVNAGGAVAVK
ncbi:hypothetical protein U1Q18_002626 [Sarracenia purpurea var. burkii]